MATKSISQLDTQATANETDLFEVAIVDANSASGYASKKESAAAIADAIVGEYQYPLRITGTTAKTIAGAINEIKSSLAPIATSGAYSDLTGKPTIDTALDTTSTNAVENRAVASEINSIKSDITVEGSASGDIAIFADGSDNPLKELKISIEAVQSGSGDPSPENVRPITGFSAVDITRVGKNLLDPSIYSEFEQEDGTYEGTGSAVNRVRITSPAQLVDKNLTFSCYIDNSNGPSTIYLMCTTGSNIYRSGSILQGSSGYLTLSVSASQINETSFFQITYGLDGGNRFKFKDLQLEISETATAYEPYNGNTYNIDWQSTAGTVYGGQLKPLTGELIVTHGNIAEYDGETINEPWISSMDVYSAGATPTTGAQVVYPLTTPVTYQLTPTEVRSLLGVNNVWADCGAITELKYTRDLNLCINDIIARIEALEGASSSRSLSVSPTLTKSLTSDSNANESILEGKAEEDTKETEEETKEEAQKNER